MNVLVANVGEHDLYYNVGTNDSPNFCHCEWGKPDMDQLVRELQCQPGARHVGKALFDRVKGDPNELKRCHYPILRTVLKHVGETQKIDLLVLIVTDQPSTTKPEYRDRDSIYTGQVLQWVIKRDFGDRVQEIRLQRYGKAPSRAPSYDFLGDLLPQIAPRKNITRFHASLSGGIPALNTSLQEQSLRIYHDKCSPYEVEAPDEQSCRLGAEQGKIIPVSIDPFMRDLVISLVEQLISRYDYSGTIELLNTFRSLQFWGNDVDALLQHAEQRLNFSFGKAADALQGYKEQPPLQQWYDRARRPVLLDQLIETYFIAKLRYINQEYPDMIWRISAFYENGLRFIGAHALGMPSLLRMKHIPQKLIQDKFSKLHAELVNDRKVHTRVSYEQRGKKECWQSSTYTWKKIASYGLKLPDQAKWRTPYLLLGRLRQLADLRNQMVHNFVGVSAEDLSEAFTQGGEEQPNHKLIIPTLYKILASLVSLTESRTPITSPYDQMNTYLGERLKSYTWHAP